MQVRGSRTFRTTMLGTTALVLTTVSLWAQGGKIEGLVRDPSGAPIADARIVVVGTAYHALTSLRGYYFINNVPAGTVRLRAVFIGYKSVEVQDLTVLTDQTLSQDFTLEPSPIQLREITILAATNPLVPRDEVTTKQRVSGDYVSQLPVDRLDQVLQLQPGVVSAQGGLTIRGGRTDEAAVYIDGVPVSPGYRLEGGSGVAGAHRTAIDIGINGFAEATVTTGAYSAEFGNAQSGIIAIATRTGGSRYAGNVGFETDEPFGVSHGVGFNRIQTSFGGPFPGVPHLTFYLSGVLNGQRSGESGFDREKSPLFVTAGIDTTVAVPSAANDPLADTTYVGIQRLAVFTGRCSEFAGSANPGIASNYGFDCQGTHLWGSATSSYQLLGKLSYTFGTGSRLALSAMGSQDQSRFGSEIFDPQQTFGHRNGSQIYTVNWTQNLSKSTERALAVDAALSYQQDRVIESPLTQKDELGSRDPLGGFLVRPFDFLFNFENFPVNSELLRNFRTNTGRRSPYDLDHPDQYALIDRYRNSPYGLGGFPEDGGPVGVLVLFRENRYVGRANLDWQVDRYNRFKLGGEFTRYYLASYAHFLTSSGAADMFIARPVRGAAYVEDRLDLGDVVVVGGLRYDYYDSHGSLPFYFDSTANKYSYFPRVLSNPDFDPAHPGSIFRPNKSHDYLSPHIQVSFPITAATNFRLSYAHQVEAPDFALILRRSSNDFGLSQGVFGSDLDFARTISFEFGIRHAFSDDMVLDIAAYNKDNLANATGRTFSEFDPVKGGHTDIQRLTTADYGNTRGVDIRLDRRIGRMFNGMLGYTYQSAKNTGDDPFSYLNRSSLIVSSVTGSNHIPTQASFPTRDSRPHNLTGALALSFPADWKQGSLAGSILNGAGVFATFRYASGNAYTRCPNVPGNESITSDQGGCSYALALGTFNGARLPAFKQFDLRVTRNFLFRGLGITGYLDARNLLNFKNVLTVFSAYNDVVSKVEHRNAWSVDSADFAAEASASGVRDTLGSMDLRFGGAVASGCGKWLNQGGEPAVPNCVYLIRAEERYGNGDHVFDLAEQRRASAAAYAATRGLFAFTGAPRQLRIGIEINF